MQDVSLVGPTFGEKTKRIRDNHPEKQNAESIHELPGPEFLPGGDPLSLTYKSNQSKIDFLTSDSYWVRP
jgi:hypothetical protein